MFVFIYCQNAQRRLFKVKKKTFMFSLHQQTLFFSWNYLMHINLESVLQAFIVLTNSRRLWTDHYPLTDEIVATVAAVVDVLTSCPTVTIRRSIVYRQLPCAACAQQATETPAPRLRVRSHGDLLRTPTRSRYLLIKGEGLSTGASHTTSPGPLLLW